MSELSRIGVAVDSDLLLRFDRFIANQGYESRSEAFRDLMRDRLAAAEIAAPQATVIGTITLVYDHHIRLLPEKLMSLQHDHHHVIVSTTHVHVDHDTCLEVVAVKGKAAEVKNLADLLISTKGVRQGHLVMTTPHLKLQTEISRTRP